MNILQVFDKKKDASITVEASLILPSYIFSIMAFIYIIQIILVQEHIQSAMTQTGEYISQYAYVYDYIKYYQEEESYIESNVNSEDISYASDIIEVLFLQTKLVDYMDKNLINHSCIVGGIDGIAMAGSDILEENDIIELKVSYMIKIPFAILGLNSMKAEQYLTIRGFTGYKPIKDNKVPSNDMEEEDRFVYITRTGTVYHTNENCTHIRLDIRETSFGRLEGERNENGGKYYPCESCMKGDQHNTDSTAYIASYGDRYHSTISCSRLKRSIITIRVSKVKDRSLCIRCKKLK